MSLDPDLDAHGDQIPSIKKPLGGHKSPQEAVKLIKSMTYFLAFPVLCGLTYVMDDAE